MDLDSIPALDHHAHNLLRPDAAAARPFVAAFTEASDPRQIESYARQTVCYRRSLHTIAAFLGCDPTEETVLVRRQEIGFEALAAQCFQAARLSGLFLDDGFLPEAILPLEWHARYVPVRRLLRLEALAQDLVQLSGDFGDFLDHYRGALDLPPANVIGFKSIAAYRTGLDIGPPDRQAAELAYESWRRQSPPHRLIDKSLLDFLLLQALEIAARREIPVQFHTGFGDPDLDLRLANPLHLRRLLEDRRLSSAPIVLLHAAYPYAREAGFLASVYPQVFTDFGLASPLLSRAGMRSAIAALLELAPTTKVMFSTDAHFFPESYFLGAREGRAALAAVLEGLIADADLSVREADEAAKDILHGNGERLYRLSQVG